MNEEQRHAMIDALEEAIPNLGFDLYRDAPRLIAYIEKHLRMIALCHSRESLDGYLASTGETEEAELGMLFALILAVPQLVQDSIRDTIRDAAALLPSRPVGHPTKLTPELRREIVTKVGKLHIAGVQMGTAQLRVAKQLGIGKRSVQMVWQERHLLTQQPFQSMSDVLQFLIDIKTKEKKR